MMQKIKKPISILLSILMVLSLFTVIPIASASAAPEPATDTADEITVYFTDAQEYGDVNIYYWPEMDNGNWPGSAMTVVGINAASQTVYKATIPTGLEGIVFNGNGRQTVDITTGIEDGAWWITLSGADQYGHNYVEKVIEEEPETEAPAAQESFEVLDLTDSSRREYNSESESYDSKDFTTDNFSVTTSSNGGPLIASENGWVLFGSSNDNIKISSLNGQIISKLVVSAGINDQLNPPVVKVGGEKIVGTLSDGVYVFEGINATEAIIESSVDNGQTRVMTVTVYYGASEPETAEPTGEPETAEPTGEPETAEPTGEPETAEPTGAPEPSPADEVIDMINALPDEITLDDKEDVEAAREAYEALDPAEQDKIDADTLQKLADAEETIAQIEADMKAAADVTELINALPDPADVTLDDKDAINEAGEAYDALTDKQKSYVSLSDKIKLALVGTVLATLEKDAEDKAAAEAVEEQIDALPAARRVTLNDKDAIEEAAAAYDALTPEQKRLVSLRDRLKLTAVKGALDALVKDAEDEAAAAAVEELIDALPAAADVTLEDKDAIEEAAAAYDALTDNQKKKIVLADRTKLAMDRTALERIEVNKAAADAVADKINALPAPEDVTLDDAGAFFEAAAAYDALTPFQKSFIDEETAQKLNDVQAALKDLYEVEGVKELINSIPEEISIRDKNLIDAAKAAYDELDDAQKALIDEETTQKLNDAVAALADIEAAIAADKAAAADVSEKINALPNALKITADDKDAVEAAAAAYDALTDAQKAYVPAADKAKLIVAKGALDAALKDAEDEAAAAAVEELIDALPAAADVTLEDKDAIEAAAAAYDALTDNQKKKIVLADRTKLAMDRAVLEAIEDNKATADTVAELINALPAAEDVTLDDTDAFIEAAAAYDSLTDYQKSFIDDETVQKLADVQEALVDLYEVEGVKELINSIPEEISIRDKNLIDAAKAAYDELDDAQKALIDEETTRKLNDAVAALADIEAAIAADKAAAADVSEKINALPNPFKITADDKDAIEEAAAAYDALTDEQKAYVPAADKAKLIVAKGALDAALKDAEDEAAAAAVEELIDALPDSADVTLDDKDAIDEAAAAYDALTDNQKKKVLLADRIKLAMDRAVLEAIEDDKAAADAVADMINALPAAEDVTLDDTDAFIDAAMAYDALTDAQKSFIDEETVQKLADVQEALADLYEVEGVKELINSIPEEISIRDKNLIDTAKAAYDELDDAQKALIDEETTRKLNDAVAALAEIEEDIAAAQPVSEQIQALPNPRRVTVDDKDAIEEAAAAYDALTDAQKAYVSPADKAKLAADQAALAAAIKDAENEAAASAVEEMIEALPAPGDVTLEDKEAIDAAAEAYFNLTPAQKAKVSFADAMKLAFDKAIVDKLENDQAAADAVIDAINALPAKDDVTMDDKDDIEAARAAYDALTDDQKALIDDETLQKLTDAEDALASKTLLGDADGDGEVSIFDITLIQRYLAGVADEIDAAAADVDGDGEVSIFDATAIQRWLAGIPVDYPINEYV